MRGAISDQDLTDYALNELGPEERLYVESMLAVSEECRNDVYQMIDVAMLLEQGFEREATAMPGELTAEQREKLIAFTPRVRYWETAAAVLAAAAAVAFAVSHPGVWQMPGGAQKVAQVSTQVSNYVVEAVRPEEGIDFGGQLANWTQLAEDPVLKKWFNSEWFSVEHGGESPSLSGTVPMPRSSFDVMP
jgi:anti-sigma factor RsiW